MKVQEYAQHDGLGLAELIRKKQVSRPEVVEAGLLAIHTANATLNAVIESYEQEARAAAHAPIDPNSPFAGVPFLLKDIGSHDANVRFELGSRLAQGLRSPPFASELVRRFRAAGVVVLGRTNVPEFGSSCTTEPRFHGATRNPWNPDRTSGGSSGGAAAAVASGMVPIAHANDAGGSIRVPASCCGLFGLKPSRNLNPVGPDAALPLNGLAAEHIVSRSVRDTAAMLDATAGPDVGAWCFTPRLAGSYLEEACVPPGRLRIALNLVPCFPPGRIDSEIIELTLASAGLCKSLGHEVEEIGALFEPSPALEAFGIIWMTSLRAALEAIAGLSGKAVNADTVEPHIFLAWHDAEQITASRLQWALEQLNVISRAYGSVFERFDVILTPLLSSEPFPLGMIANIPSERFQDWFQGMCRHSPFTASANAAGIPAMSVPLGWTRSGLPVGSHFLAGLGNELTLLRLAMQLEAAQPWIGRKPLYHVTNSAAFAETPTK